MNIKNVFKKFVIIISLDFSMIAQIFTDHGYVIILPNVRESTDYGSEFRDACIKDWGQRP